MSKSKYRSLFVLLSTLSNRHIYSKIYTAHVHTCTSISIIIIIITEYSTTFNYDIWNFIYIYISEGVDKVQK